MSWIKPSASFSASSPTSFCVISSRRWPIKIPRISRMLALASGSSLILLTISEGELFGFEVLKESLPVIVNCVRDEHFTHLRLICFHQGHLGLNPILHYAPGDTLDLQIGRAH